MENIQLFHYLIYIYHNADWINVGLGFFLSLLVPLLIYLFKFIIYILKVNPYKGYYGNYFLYAYYLLQAQNGKKVNTVKITIKKNYFGNPKVIWIDGNYKYEGEFYKYDKNIYIKVTGTTHKEDQLIIFNAPLLAEQFDLVFGIKVAITANSEPAASINLLSRNELNIKDVQSILGKNKNLKLSRTKEKIPILKDNSTLLPKKEISKKNLIKKSNRGIKGYR